MQKASLRVLVADDEPLTRWAVAQALAPLGEDVTEVASREDACCKLFGGRFDIVVMASRIEGADMTDVLRQLTKREEPLRLVVLCEDETHSPVLREQLPAARVIDKPFSLEALLAAVEAA